MKKKWIIIVIFLAYLIIVVDLFVGFRSYFNAYGPFQIGDINRFVTLTSISGRYSISSPNGWKELDSLKHYSDVEYLVSIIESKNPRAFINVYKFDRKFAGIKEIVNWQKQEKSSLDSLYTLSFSQMRLGKNEGVLWEYTFRVSTAIGKYTSHCYDWILENEGGYLFLFCTSDRIWNYGHPIIIQMIESIELL